MKHSCVMSRCWRSQINSSREIARPDFWLTFRILDMTFPPICPIHKVQYPERLGGQAETS